MKKKLLPIILSFGLALCFAGCDNYVLPTKKPADWDGNYSAPNNGVEGEDGPGGNNNGGNNNGGNNNNGNNNGNNSSNDENAPFTVTLKLDGQVYTKAEGIEAVWSNRFGMYSAEFVNGVATMEGLDGEYHVTLSDVPKEKDFTYDSSGYYASNNNKAIEVELLEVLSPSKDWQGWYKMTKLGTYRAQVTKKTANPPSSITTGSTGGLVVYYFQPNAPGWYSITSWVDTGENSVNPFLYRYNGQVAGGFAYYDRTIEGGGSSGTYTKNFMLEYKIFDEEVGNAQIFAVGAESLKGYPVDIEFTIKYEGEYRNPYVGDPVFANGPFYKGAKPAGSWRYIYADSNNILLGSKVKFNEEDQFYHVYDEDEYADNNGFGPTLYARLTKDTQIMVTMDALSGHVFDMGFNWNQLNDGMVSCVINGNDYAYMITSSKVDGVSHEGYDKYCNSDGAHPVNKEIRDFLQGYAEREKFFNDGDGWAESKEMNGYIKLDSGEDDQWLFACGYYR